MQRNLTLFDFKIVIERLNAATPNNLIESAKRHLTTWLQSIITGDDNKRLQNLFLNELKLLRKQSTFSDASSLIAVQTILDFSNFIILKHLYTTEEINELIKAVQFNKTEPTSSLCTKWNIPSQMHSSYYSPSFGLKHIFDKNIQAAVILFQQAQAYYNDCEDEHALSYFEKAMSCLDHLPNHFRTSHTITLEQISYIRFCDIIIFNAFKLCLSKKYHEAFESLNKLEAILKSGNDTISKSLKRRFNLLKMFIRHSAAGLSQNQNKIDMILLSLANAQFFYVFIQSKTSQMNELEKTSFYYLSAIKNYLNRSPAEGYLEFDYAFLKYAYVMYAKTLYRLGVIYADNKCHLDARLTARKSMDYLLQVLNIKTNTPLVHLYKTKVRQYLPNVARLNIQIELSFAEEAYKVGQTNTALVHIREARSALAQISEKSEVDIKNCLLIENIEERISNSTISNENPYVTPRSRAG